MISQIAEAPMAKKKSAPKRNDVTVKVDAHVIRLAKVVAAYQGKTLAEFLSDELNPVVARLHEQEVAKQAKLGTRDKGSK